MTSEPLIKDGTSFLFVDRTTGTYYGKLGGHQVLKGDIKDLFGQSDAVQDTGLLPCDGTGLLRHLKWSGHEQIIYQIAPTHSYVKWGNCEGDEDAVTYKLATPYKIIIADYQDDNLVGVRHFFSVTPVTHWQTQLYATPYSNTNNMGYGMTSIGWVCIYRNGQLQSSLAEKIEYALWREDGYAEPYNFDNTSNTDGPTFYSLLKQNDTTFHGPDPWQTASAKHDLNWFLNPDLYIPYAIEPKHGSLTHYSEVVYNHGYGHSPRPPANTTPIPYTLDLAANTPYYPYYDIRVTPPVNADREKPSLTVAQDKIDALINQSYTHKKQILKLSDFLEGFVSAKPPGFAPVKTQVIPTLPSASLVSCDFCKAEHAENLSSKFIKGIPYTTNQNGFPIINRKLFTSSVNGVEIFHCCLSCTGNLVKNPNYPYMLSKADTLFSEAEYRYVFKEFVRTCPKCHSSYNITGDPSPLIFGEQLHPDHAVCCVNCEPDSWVFDEFARQRILTTVAVKVELAASSKKSRHLVHPTTLSRICACGLVDQAGPFVSTETGLKKCVSCKNVPLIRYSGKSYDSEIVEQNEGATVFVENVTYTVVTQTTTTNTANPEIIHQLQATPLEQLHDTYAPDVTVNDAEVFAEEDIF